MRCKVLQWGAVLFSSIMLNACVPSYLQKYSRTGPTEEVAPYSSVDGRQQKVSAKNKATIYAVGNNTFRFRLGYDQVWNGALNVLMNNYNINTLDKDSGIITTEWDSFYLNDKVYRNKVSMHLKRAAWNTIDLVMYNNVEVLHSGDVSKGNAIWLPAAPNKREVGRIVQNMALALNQSPPLLPEEMMARTPPKQTAR